MSLLSIFAANLKRQRLRHQLTQTDLAHRAGICVAYVSMLERGQRSPPLETIEALARSLDVPPTKLLAA